jgi:hypothetical protein
MGNFDWVNFGLLLVTAASAVIAWIAMVAARRAGNHAKVAAEEAHVANEIAANALKLSKSDKDPLFVLEARPEAWMKIRSDEPMRQVAFRLINRGKSYVRDVSLTAIFDPFGYFVPRFNCALLEGDGAYAEFSTCFEGDSIAIKVLSQVLNDGGEQAMCRVTYITSIGERGEQLVRMPNPYEFMPVVDRT